MIKKLSIVAVVLTSGCHLEKPYVYPLDIIIKDNAPCFALPADRQKKGDPVLNRGAIIARLTGGKWVNIWHSDPQPPFTIIPAGQCISYPEINWQPGDYSVVMTITSERDDEKLRLVNTIRLRKNRAGHFSLQEIQKPHD